MRYAAMIAACVLAVLLAAQSAPAAEGVKIAVVDVSRIGAECKYKAEYEQGMKELIDRKRHEGRELSAEVRARMEEIEKEMMLLAPEAKAEKQREMSVETRKLQEFDTEAKREVQELGQAYSEKLAEKIRAAIREVGEEQGLDLIFDSGVLLYRKELPDLTDEVLTKLDAAFDQEHGATEAEEETEPETEPETETTPTDSDEGR